ncbi:hypothetical protein GBA52_019360 [Prunus armeniaca]|nr:hypothetical protein GBA52_019360 [Prunus armeniaca]
MPKSKNTKLATSSILNETQSELSLFDTHSIVDPNIIDGPGKNQNIDADRHSEPSIETQSNRPHVPPKSQINKHKNHLPI